MNKVILIIFLLYSSTLFAQNKQASVDSLKNLLSETSDEVSDMEVLNQLVIADIFSFDDAFEYGSQALTLALKLEDKQAEGDIKYNLGRLHGFHEKYMTALTFYEQALKLREAQGDKRKIGNTLSKMGLIYIKGGQSIKAMQCFQRALELFREVGSRDVTSNLLDNQSEQDAPLLEILSKLYLRQTNYTLALDFANRSLSQYELENNKEGICDVLMIIAETVSSQKKYSLGIEKGKDALDIAIGIKDSERQMKAILLISNIYNTMKDFENAYQYLIKSIELQKSTKSTIEKQEQDLKDALSIQIRYETLKQDYNRIETNLIRREDLNLIYVAVFGFVIIALILFFFYFLKKRQYTIEALQAHLDRLHAEQKARELKEQANEYMGRVYKEVAKEKEASEKEKEDRISNFAFINAHKVRRPLASILGLIDVMSRPEVSLEEKNTYITMINECAKELDEVVKDINENLTKSENGNEVF